MSHTHMTNACAHCSSSAAENDYTLAARYTTATATTCCSQELQVLDLSFNDFTELPVSSGLLTLRNLKQLHLDFNSLNSLTSTLSDSPVGASLELLGLQCNALEAVPEVLFKLPKLKALRLGGNAIAANQMRASEFLALEQLEHLSLYSTCEL
jgi:Leucine-rich repeat (LRR) protein